MIIDTGLAAVIVAVLVFYLRLIVIQREAARRSRLELQKAVKKVGSKASKKSARAGKAAVQAGASRSILSKNRLDLAIAGAGLLAIVAGVLAYAGLIRLSALQTYWWVPTSLGIVAFSWAFKLPK